MCLQKLDNVTKPAKFGYKIFMLITNALHGEYYEGKYEVDTWHNAEITDIHDDAGNFYYKSGFHAYVCDKKIIEDYINVYLAHHGCIVKKVELDEITASGVQHLPNQENVTTVVAKKMRIL